MAWIKNFRYFENLNVLLNKSINRKFPKIKYFLSAKGKISQSPVEECCPHTRNEL
jgi:hypothetical protein